jgi:hypothetical protein
MADLLVPLVYLAHLGEVDSTQRDLLFFAILGLDGDPSNDVVLGRVHFGDSASLEGGSPRNAMVFFELLEENTVTNLELDVPGALARKSVG